jgi:Rab GDP dissociation inhibitor
MLVHTDVIRYLEFKVIAGSYVYRDGRISKVPSTEMEAVKSSLMGLFEKRRARNFFLFIQNWKEDDPATHQGRLICPLEGRELTCRPRHQQSHHEGGVYQVWT